MIWSVRFLSLFGGEFYYRTDCSLSSLCSAHIADYSDPARPTISL